jgi:GTP-binding protein EngB required for normal cell division
LVPTKIPPTPDPIEVAAMAAVEHQPESKPSLAMIIERFRALAHRRVDERFQQRLDELTQKLSSGQLSLVVLGQFKRGKSSLINALLGAEVLPTAVIPLTSIVTIVRYGPEPSATVQYVDGTETEIDVATIAEFITERANPNNVKRVAQVEVSFPSPFLHKGVRLVDTPGVGSVFVNNTIATYDYLPEADAAIFLVASDQPVGQAEVDFLQAARSYAAKVFFVLNKIDYLNEEELEESKAFTRRTLSDAIGSDVTVHPVSARTALIGKLASDRKLHDRSRLPELEAALNGFLSFEKQATLHAIIASRLRSLVSEARYSIELEMAALRMPIELLTERATVFTRTIDQIVQEQSDTQYLLSGEIRELVSAVESDLAPFVEQQIEPLRRRMAESFARNKHLGRGKLVNAMNEERSLAVQEIFSAWRKREEDRLGANFARITERFANRANGYTAEIERAAGDLFDVQVCPVIEIEPLTAESGHYYYTENPFSLQLSALPLLLPGPLGKAYIKKEFVNGCAEELYRNAGRLRSDFQERLEKSAESFRTGFVEGVRSSAGALEDALHRAAEEKKRGGVALESSIPGLKADLDELHHLSSLIDSVHTEQSPVADTDDRRG